MPDHLQQSDPGFQELRMPDGSAVMEDLKPKRPVSSSTWQVADVTWIKEHVARNDEDGNNYAHWSKSSKSAQTISAKLRNQN
nr:hypothetical protein CFP56_67959 [Quercus suber]